MSRHIAEQFELPLDVEPVEYQMLPVGTIIREGDQIFEHSGLWEPVVDLVGFEVDEGEYGEYRRPLTRTPHVP